MRWTNCPLQVFGAGSSSLSSRSAVTHASKASRASATASSMVSASAMHPGRSGMVTRYPPPSSSGRVDVDRIVFELHRAASIQYHQASDVEGLDGLVHGDRQVSAQSVGDHRVAGSSLPEGQAVSPHYRFDVAGRPIRLRIGSHGVEQSLRNSCITCRPTRTFTAQNTGVSGRNSMWLKFTASEDRPHAPMAIFSSSFPRKRESTSITKVSGFPLSRE